jgi:hypothetical protein
LHTDNTNAPAGKLSLEKFGVELNTCLSIEGGGGTDKNLTG